jgi:hypothetical protein
MARRRPSPLSGIGGAGGGGKGGSGSSRAPVESPNTLRSRAVARVLDVVSEGEIGGLVDGYKSIYLDGTPVMDAEGNMNFPGFVAHERKGTADQDYIEGFPSAETPVAVGVEVVYATPITRRVTSTSVDAAKIVMTIPALTEADTATGDLKGNSVTIEIWVKADADNVASSYVRRIRHTISGKTTGSVQQEYRVALEGVAPFDIQFRRISPDEVLATRNSQTVWSTLIELVDAKIAYNDTAVIGIEVDSEQFGSSIPARGYLIDGLLVKIPSNMDGTARTFTGEWDGTFKTEWTDDPAWIGYDLVTQDRYGLGDVFQAADIDKWDLYQISVYNSEQVDDGAGGTEPRFRFNGTIATREDALRVLDAIFGMMRASLLWTGSQLGFIQSSPQSVTKPYAPANVIQGKFNYAGSSLTARHSVAHVTWNNPALNYERDVIVIEDTASIERYGYNVLETTAYGCTSPGQAYRHGLAQLLTERLETDAVQFEVGLGDADIRPGDLVEVRDPTFTTQAFAGRLKQVIGSSDAVVAGAGSVSIGAMTVSATGAVATVTRTGTGSVSIGALTASATGVIGAAGVTGTGSVDIGALTVSADGVVSIAGAGSVSLGALTITGAGTLAVTGDGDVSIGALTVAAAGVIGTVSVGTGSVSIGEMTVTADGVVSITATGSVDIGALTVAATGTLSFAEITGDGDVSVGALTASAAGAVNVTGAGSVSVGALTVAAAGTVASAAAAPTFRSTSAVVDALTVSKPSGTVEGDLLIGVFYSYAGTGLMVAPSGWTTIDQQTVTANSFSHNATIAYKIAGASEPATYTFSTSGSGEFFCAELACYSGATGVDVWNTTEGSSPTRTNAGITTANNYSKVFMASVGVYNPPLVSAPSGFTQRAVDPDAVVYLWDKDFNTAGATGSLNSVHTIGYNENDNYITFAVELTSV